VRLIQLESPQGRRLGVVEDDRIRLLSGPRSVYDFVAQRDERGDEFLDYGPIYAGDSAWRILPAIDHPAEPARCMVSGTGLTHIRSAANRNAMHAAAAAETDSMKMYRWGVEGGKPAPGEAGTSPEWFYKGTGLALRAHNQPLDVPAYAEDGGEEPEVAGVYVIDASGTPRRIGLVTGNEFSDHVLEKRNYLYLASSKLRPCAIGPELVLDAPFDLIEGEVSIERAGAVLWSKAIRTGESAMCHSLANIEHHHFKFEAHRRPGDVHVHFFGADAFSFGEGIRLQDGDVMQVRWDGLGRPLRNAVRQAGTSQAGA
jgi:hypothetical protein